MGNYGVYPTMGARGIILLAAVVLLAGCANTPMGRSIREGFYTQARALYAYQGDTQEDIPRLKECQFTQLIGQPLSAVIECFGKPYVYALGVEEDGYVSYQVGALYGITPTGTDPTHGFTVRLRKGKVVDIVRF